MKNLLISALIAIGTAIGTISTGACLILLLDEPEMPESLLD